VSETEYRAAAFADTNYNLCRELAMRTTVALDDDLVRIAQEFTGIAENTALIREALKALIERESARRLVALGGTMRGVETGPTFANTRQTWGTQD
jgi:Arc/MetJ family transcription regulator